MSRSLMIAALVLACVVLAVVVLGLAATMISGRRRPPVCPLCDGIDRTAVCECSDGCGAIYCAAYPMRRDAR